MSAPPTVAPCTIRDADVDEAEFLDLVADQAGLFVHPGRAGAHTRVAVRDGQVAGFASVTRHADGHELDFVFVHHHARRLGVGRALVLDSTGHGGPVRVVAHPAAEVFFRRVGALRLGSLPPCARHPFTRPLFVVG